MSLTCHHCGSEIPDGTPNGVCPACLMSLAGVHTATMGNIDLAPASVEELQGRIPGVILSTLIGYGGMGAVYQGRQVELDRDVAVKVLPESLSQDPIFVRRFRREAQALAKLDHPNIVTVFGSGVSDGLCYIVMEHVEGTTLRDAMNADAVDPAAALKIVPQICDALAYAHEQGVVHRDIKPENILLGVGGRVKVVDFGLAKLSDDDRSHTMLTATGARLGTLRYMAPEQLDGNAVDHRADVYSLGVVFYEMLTGQVPMGQFALPSEKAGVDPRIDEVVMRTLRREPSDRYQNASEVEHELDSISRGGGSYGWDAPMSRFAGTQQQLWVAPAREWKSNASLFGLPVVHVAYGQDRQTGRKLVAKGIIAIGDVAVGGLAIGGVSFGIMSLGGVAVGLNALGGAAIGLQLALGGGAVGGVAVGGAAVGGIAHGGAAAGGVAVGGAAGGYLAAGGQAQGEYVLSRATDVWTPAEFADSWIAQWLASPAFPWVVGLAMMAMLIGPALLVGAMAFIGFVRARVRGVQEKRMPSQVRGQILTSVLGVLLICIVLPIVSVVYAREFRQTVVRAVDERQRDVPMQLADPSDQPLIPENPTPDQRTR